MVEVIKQLREELDLQTNRKQKVSIVQGQDLRLDNRHSFLGVGEFLTFNIFLNTRDVIKHKSLILHTK